MEIIKVKGNTFCIDTGMSYIPFYKITEKEIIMLDSGWAKGERKGIDALIDENEFVIRGIICSHAHIDHVGNNAYFKNKFKCTIAMSAYAAHVCSSPSNLKVYYNNQTLSDIIERYEDMICETDIMIPEHQESIYMCGVKFKILQTPGHSPAHISIITPDDVAYLGDALISHQVMAGMKLPYAFILKEDLKSKEKLYSVKCSRYVMAHKGIYDEITDLIADNINFYKHRAQRVYEMIEGTMTHEDIMRKIVRAWEINVESTYKHYMVERMLKSYVQYLNETGMIELIMEDGFLKYRKEAQIS